MSAEYSLECPVCMTLPEGQVHQCNEGHCYCVDCWNRLEASTRAVALSAAWRCPY